MLQDTDKIAGTGNAMKAAQVWSPAAEVFLFAKGRVALYAILRAMGIGPGEEVLVPGYTCVVVPAAVCYVGARPVYYDIDPTSYCGDAADAEARITSATRAVVLQHTYGMPGEDAELVKLCRQRGIHVIEDCAHGMGGLVDGRALGTLGDAAFASFQWTKPVSVGLGGVARAASAELFEAMTSVAGRELRAPSLARSLTFLLLAWGHQRFMTPRLYWSVRGLYHALGRFGVLAQSSSADELEQPETMPAGYLESFGRLRRRQLAAALDRLPETVAHRAQIAAIYEAWCAERNVPVQRWTAGASPVRLRFPIRVRERERLLKAAREARIELGDWFNAPLHPDIHEAPGLAYRRGMCPRAEQAAREVVNLPTHPGVTPEEAERVLDFMASHSDWLIRRTS